MRVREVITFKGWVEGSGWSYESDYEERIIEIPGDKVGDFVYDWDWVEPSYLRKNEDTKIVVKWYLEDCEDIDDAEPIAVFSKWLSEIGRNL